tara:strand:+ start:123 stop:632 length:510 start_codon:yes stop_codon:yes gene_type:complete
MFKWLYKKGHKSSIKKIFENININPNSYPEELLDEAIIQINEDVKSIQKEESLGFNESVRVEKTKLTSLAYILSLNTELHIMLNSETYKEVSTSHYETKLDMLQYLGAKDNMLYLEVFVDIKATLGRKIFRVEFENIKILLNKYNQPNYIDDIIELIKSTDLGISNAFD